MKRVSRHITDKKDIEYFLSIKEKDITNTFIMEAFGEFNEKARFQPFDTITIPKGSYGPEGRKNKNDFVTTLGIWIYNKYFIENDLFDLFKYINKTINKKMMGDMNDKLSYALIEDDITIEQLQRFLMKTQDMMRYISILSPNHTMKILTIPKGIEKRKKELIKEYKDEIKAGNPEVAEMMEKELMKTARDYIGDDEGFDWIDSGARASWGNNIKNMYIMKGAMKDPNPNIGFNIATSSYAEGIKKEEYNLHANALAEGPYKRACKTALGGYWEKLLLSAFQHVILGKPGSDCGSTNYIEVDFSKENMKLYMYSYIIEGNNLVELTSKNMDKYKGKKVKMRFSAMCKDKKCICNKCAGNLFYRTGRKNIGMAMPVIGSTLKRKSMKSFHDATVSMHTIDVAKAFGTD